MRRRLIPGDIKNDYEDEVAEWVDEQVSSSYHTITIPYGPKYHARKIEKLLYTKDLLLNAEWNKPKDREVNLHCHPAFFGTVEDVIHDCCGYCPEPTTVEEEEVAEEESKVYISGNVQFMKDDPGRQAIGSFNPLTPEDWTTMAYVGNTFALCQAIVDGDLEYVQSWLKIEGNDCNTRDYTGRAPLHLAVVNSTPEIVQALIDNGARLVARLVDGKTALHLAAMHGSVAIVSAIMQKSEANENEHEEKVEARRAVRRSEKRETPRDVTMEDANQPRPASRAAEDESDIEMVETADVDEDEDMDATTEHSMVNIKSPGKEVDDEALANEDDDSEPDFCNVNVVAWDTAVSALHLAIVQGHVDVVKCLVQDFGADVLLPIKLLNDHDKSARAAILTLVLALQLPIEKAEVMARTLIQLGASSAQASIDQTTGLQFCVADRPDLLDSLADADATGVSRAINHLSVSGYRWSVEVTSPLMTAIRAKDGLTALRLLALGAKPEIAFSAYMKAYQTRHDPPKDSKQNKRNFEQSIEQPILSAVRCELPLLAKSLIEEHGVDPNTITQDGLRVLNDEHSWRHTKGRSLHDVVRKKLKALRNWESKRHEPEKPEPLKDDVEYLSGFKQGSYALWSAQKQLNGAKERYENDLESYKERLEDLKDREGVAEKQEAINHMISNFEKLETALVQQGAKGFYELHPQVKKPEKRDRPSYGYNRHRDEPKEFQVELKFQLGDLTEQSQKRYEELFQAAWNDDIKTVKEITLNTWKDDQEDDQPPSKVAVQDQHGLSPFSIAILHSHLELASVIMEIARAQHVSADPPKKQRYQIGAEGSEDEDASSDDGVHMYSEIVDDEFTVEDVGEVSMQVKSRVLPIDMMQWACPVADFIKSRSKMSSPSNQGGGSGFSYFGPRRTTTMAGKRTNTGSIKLPGPSSSSDRPKKEVPAPTTLLRFAIHENDQELLTLLLGYGRDFFLARPEQDDEVTKYPYAISDRDFEYAVQVGHAHLLAEIIKSAGAGMPLTALANKYGAELKEKPKYYQGLSVYGSKRRDWADAGRNQIGFQPAQNHRTPLLLSAYFGSLEAVEWFLSDSPTRCYNEFGEANKEDKRVRRLSMSQTGFDGTVEKFLKTRSHLAIHCSILGQPTVEAESVLRYLIQAMPDAVEARSVEGFTPLQVAFELYREHAAKLLIHAGADQTCRDKGGRNILHSLLSRAFEREEHVNHLKRMLDLIDKRVLPTLFVERSTGSLTPMHYWLKNCRYQFWRTKVMNILLEYGGGQELSLISGEGDTPLHHSVMGSDYELARIILEHDPALLNRENATGRTPFEMAEDGALAAVCNDPPPMPKDHGFAERRAKRYGLHSYWAQDVMNRAPHSFVEEPDTRLSAREEVWKIVQGTKAKLDAEGKSKRRLVTLNEASEVARRLAAMKSGKTVHDDDDENDSNEEEDEEKVGDEVQVYLEPARRQLEAEV